MTANQGALDALSYHHFRVGEIVRTLLSRENHEVDRRISISENNHQLRGQLRRTFDNFLTWRDAVTHRDGGFVTDETGNRTHRRPPHLTQERIESLIASLPNERSGLPPATLQAIESLRQELRTIADIQNNGLAPRHVPAAQAYNVLLQDPESPRVIALRHPLNHFDAKPADGTIRSPSEILNSTAYLRSASEGFNIPPSSIPVSPPAPSIARGALSSEERARRMAALQAQMGRLASGTGRLLKPAGVLLAGYALESFIQQAHAHVLEGRMSQEAFDEYRGLVLTSIGSGLLDPTFLASETIGRARFADFAARHGLSEDLRRDLDFNLFASQTPEERATNRERQRDNARQWRRQQASGYYAEAAPDNRTLAAAMEARPSTPISGGDDTGTPSPMPPVVLAGTSTPPVQQR
jgi:hypothetical protein